MGYVSGLPAVAPEVPGDQLPDVKDRVTVSNKYWEANGLAARDHTAEAIARYREALSDDPSLAAGWDRLAGLLVGSGRLKEAGEAVSSLLSLYPDDTRTAEADQRVQQALGAAPTADQFAVAAAVWTSLGEKARASDVRSAARKAVGDAAMRKAEAGLKKR
jgi:tetratricopeptide (TPR) repeat protein